VTSNNETAAAPDCQGCPFNTATHIARSADHELLLCECCAEAHDEADGWTVVDLPATTSELPTSRTSSSPDRTQQVPAPGAN
jgi:hypothetical protein